MYFILKNKKDTENIVDFLVKEYSFPKIGRRLNMYASRDCEITVEILNNNIRYREQNDGKFVTVKNKNLKYLFMYLSKKWNEYIINDIELLEFEHATLLFDTFHGNLLTVTDENLIETLKDKFSFETYEKISDHKQLFINKPEPLFDKMGNLNIKIKTYATKTALDIRSSSPSIKLRLANLSNDYSHIEKHFLTITKNELLSTKTKVNFIEKFDNISIIIPCYNCNVIPTLLSIQGQNISCENKKKIQVILVDDGSSNSVLEDIKDYRQMLDYELNVITLDKNMGLSNARNAGISLAKHNLLLFIDSDIVLSKNYLYDINMRLQIVPNAIFVAMRKNIDKDSNILLQDNLLKGVNSSFDLDDSRVTTKRKDYHIGWEKAYKDDTISILDDTNSFKQLGFGTKVGIYDLPTIVTGHNVAINRNLIKKYPAFSTKFRGWGLEDSYFASLVIAGGAFVIPVLSSCVYHINHEPRSGSIEQKKLEAQINYDIYNQMIDERWEE